MATPMIWDLAVEAGLKKQKSTNAENIEATMLFVGDKNCGKTSVINRFLARNEVSRPTVAMEYTFARVGRGSSTASKKICHIWELGGGTWLSKLIESAVTVESLRNLILVIMLDLSNPSGLISTLDTFIEAILVRINTILDRLDESGTSRTAAAASDSTNDTASLRDTLLAAKRKRREERAKSSAVAENEEETSNTGEQSGSSGGGGIDQFPVPLIILGGKYDSFEKLPLESRKVVCRTLRYAAHKQGAAIQMFSMQQETLVGRTRALLSHYAFGSTENRSLQLSPQQPLSIPALFDSFQDIGGPATKDDEAIASSLTEWARWKAAYRTFFPALDVGQTASDSQDPAKDERYVEHYVDEKRKEKDMELEKYRKISDRKMRDLKQQAINEGIMII